MKYQEFFKEYTNRDPRLKDQVFLLDMPFYYSPYQIAKDFAEVLIEPAYRSTNIMEVAKPADKTTISKEQISDARTFIQDTPYQGNTQVLIINDADWMSEEQQNILLKTLEEPPKHSVIFLISPYRRLLGTIQSRSHTVEWFDFTIGSSTPELIKKFLSDSPQHNTWLERFTANFPKDFIAATKLIEEITKSESERVALESLFLWTLRTGKAPKYRTYIEETMHTVFFTTAKNQTALESLFLKLI
jgi:hypothetical protein